MVRLEPADDGFTITLDGRRALAHSPRAPLVEFGNADPLVRQRKGSYRLRQTGFRRTAARAWRVVEADAVGLVVEFPGVALMRVVDDGGALRLSFSGYDPGFNRFRMRLPAAPGESVYGCGERYSRLDLKGSRVPLWIRERGIGRDPVALLAGLRGNNGGGRHATSFAQPSFLTSGRAYVLVDTSAYCVFDFRRSRVTVIDSWAVPRGITVGYADDAPAAVRAVSDLAGRQPAMPAWTWNGVWLGVQGGADAVATKVEAAASAGVRVGALWIEDWCGRRTPGPGARAMRDCAYDERLYPEFPDDIARYRKAGIRCLGYVSPCLAVDGALFREAGTRGYCVKRTDGTDYLTPGTTAPAAIVDLWNPEAFEWMKAVMRRGMLAIGMAGWMADGGEHLPVDCVLHGGVDPLEAHNQYPALWARANAEAIREAGREGDAVFFMRSGWTGSARVVPAVWAGDQLVDWGRGDGLADLVPAGISLGLSGVGNWHADIGGCVNYAWKRRSRELLMRWVEYAAFTPVMRSHEGGRPEANAQLWDDPALLAHLARMVSIWSGLAPYHEAAAREYAESGLPPIRHAWMHYEDDPALRHLDRQYLYGRDLLVAPVLNPGRETAEAILPDDRWVHLWSSREFRGGPVSIEAPLGSPPVFYRAGSAWAGLFDELRRGAGKA